MPVRIGVQTVVDIVPRGFNSGMESLPLYVVIFLGRLLPSKVDAKLSIGLGHPQRAYSHSHRQRDGREHSEYEFWLLHESYLSED